MWLYRRPSYVKLVHYDEVNVIHDHTIQEKSLHHLAVLVSSVYYDLKKREEENSKENYQLKFYIIKIDHKFCMYIAQKASLSHFPFIIIIIRW